MINDDDIIVWPEGTWCYGHELEEMNHMSDDYTVLVVDSEPWLEHVGGADHD